MKAISQIALTFWVAISNRMMRNKRVICEGKCTGEQATGECIANPDGSDYSCACNLHFTGKDCTVAEKCQYKCTGEHTTGECILNHNGSDYWCVCKPEFTGQDCTIAVQQPTGLIIFLVAGMMLMIDLSVMAIVWRHTLRSQRRIENEKLHKCESCLDEFGAEGVVTCGAGTHTFCVHNGCFYGLFKTQEPNLRTQNFGLQCPIVSCNAPFQLYDLAKTVPHELWAEVFASTIEARNATTRAEFEQHFDERLGAALATSVDHFTQNARLKATEIREKALNLRCPHCKSVYTDFDGCAVLQCEACRGLFCAFCHDAYASWESDEAHAHVLGCVYNEDRKKRGYYAPADAIPRIQKELRIRSMKTMLHAMEPKMRRAVVIELWVELKDLQIDPVAFLGE